MMIVLSLYLLSLSAALAFPDFELCNLKTWIGGGPFGQFGIANFSKGGNADCVLTGVPRFFSPCDTVTLTLASKNPLGHKVAVSAGTLGNAFGATIRQNDACRHTGRAKVSFTSYRWTAPPDSTASVSFGALCGDMRASIVLFAADQKVSTNNNTAKVFPACQLDAAAGEDLPPGNTAQAIEDNIPLLAGIGGTVVAGLGLAGLFAFRRKNSRNPGEAVVEKIEDVGNTVKQRLQSMRPAMAGGSGFNRMQESAPQQQMAYPQQGMGALQAQAARQYEQQYPAGQQRYPQASPQYQGQQQQQYSQSQQQYYQQQQRPQAAAMQPYAGQQYGTNPNQQYGASPGQQPYDNGRGGPSSNQQYGRGAPSSNQQFARGYSATQFSSSQQPYNMQQQFSGGQRQQGGYGGGYNLSASNPAFGQ